MDPAKILESWKALVGLVTAMAALVAIVVTATRWVDGTTESIAELKQAVGELRSDAQARNEQLDLKVGGLRENVERLGRNAQEVVRVANTRGNAVELEAPVDAPAPLPCGSRTLAEAAQAGSLKIKQGNEAHLPDRPRFWVQADDVKDSRATLCVRREGRQGDPMCRQAMRPGERMAVEEGDECVFVSLDRAKAGLIFPDWVQVSVYTTPL